MATKGSAEGFAAKRPDHLHPEGRRWPPKGQQLVLQQRDQITYYLRAGDDHQRVSSRFCSKETRSLTPLRQEMVSSRFCKKRSDHLPTEDRKWPGNGQQVLDQRNQVPYILRSRDGHQGSAAGFAAKRTDHLLPEDMTWPSKGQQQRPDHLLPEGRRGQPKDQQQVLKYSDQITYYLRWPPKG